MFCLVDKKLITKFPLILAMSLVFDFHWGNYALFIVQKCVWIKSAIGLKRACDWT
jgi:hypothetical protein